MLAEGSGERLISIKLTLGQPPFCLKRFGFPFSAILMEIIGFPYVKSKIMINKYVLIVKGVESARRKPLIIGELARVIGYVTVSNEFIRHLKNVFHG